MTAYRKQAGAQSSHSETPVERIGIAKGKISFPDDFDEYDDEIAGLFEGTSTKDIKKDLPHHHDDGSKEIIRHFPQADVIEAVAQAMKQLGDPSRLRIYWFLCHTEECVLDIAAAVDMSSPAVSHHLRLLKAAGLITSRRCGKEMFYKAADTPLAEHLHHTIEEIGDISCPK